MRDGRVERAFLSHPHDKETRALRSSSNARYVLGVHPLARPLFATLVTATSGALLLLACNGDTDTGTTPAEDAGRLKEPLRPDASCPVVIDTPELLASPHVAENSPVTYNSNPPSSGPHYPVWANFQEFGQPVPRGYLVHSMEHGAVLLLYKCPAGPCDAVVAELRKVRDAVATDPGCDPSIRVRVIIAPDPELASPVAAAAWGWIYNAECVDVPTLTAFARDRYARAPENFCTPGRVF
jgi:hypothetical protein